MRKHVAQCCIVLSEQHNLDASRRVYDVDAFPHASCCRPVMQRFVTIPRSNGRGFFFFLTSGAPVKST